MDEIDLAQQRQADEIEHALAARRPAGPGLAECRACGTAISALRTALGAQLCIECQTELEHLQRTVGLGP